MDLKKAIRKIVALGMGATMLGSMGALAQTTEDATISSEATSLNMYPDKYVTDGAYNGYLVAGGHPEDTLALAEVSSHIYYKTEGTSETTTSTTTDLSDAYLVKTVAEHLENEEKLKDVREVIDGGDYDLLETYTISGKDTVDAKQNIYLGEGKVVYAENMDYEIGYFLKFASSENVGRIYLDFSPNWESDWDADNYCEDYRFKTLKIMGKEYDIVKAENVSSKPKLTLMTGATQKTISEGEEMTLSVDGETYNIKLVGVFTNGDTTWTINGETLTSLTQGNTKQLSTGVNFGLSNVDLQDYAGGIKQATFYVGADKVILENGRSIEINGDSYADSAVTITGSVSSTKCSIGSIDINVTADDDFYVPEGAFLSENDYLNEPARLMGLDYYFDGFGDVEYNVVELKASGSSRYKLDFDNSRGYSCSLPLVYADTSGLGLGESDSKLLAAYPVSGSLLPITRSGYFIVNTKDAADSTKNSESYIMRYNGADSNASSTPKLTISSLCGEDQQNLDLTTGTATDNSFHGVKLELQNASAYTSNNFNVTLNTARHSGNIGTAYNNPYVKLRGNGNLLINISNVDINQSGTPAYDNITTAKVTFKIDDTTLFDDSLSSAETIGTFTLTNNTDRQVRMARSTSFTELPDPDDTDVNYWSTVYGALVEFRSPSGSPQSLKINYPTEQLEPRVYVAAATSTATTKDAPSNYKLATVPVQRTLTPSEAMTMLDNELINMIVVGGPCANAVAALLKNNPANCAADYVPGQGYIESFKLMKGDEEAYALLIAGYSAADTRRTANVFATYYDYEDEFGTNTKLTVEAPETDGGDVQVTA